MHEQLVKQVEKIRALPNKFGKAYSHLVSPEKVSLGGGNSWRAGHPTFDRCEWQGM